MRDEVCRIVLTGGPCAGKTTGILYLEEKLSDYGITVFKVPEMATFLASAGINFGRLAKEKPKAYLAVEELLLRMVINFEDELGRLAEFFPGQRKVLLCDRGTMDIMGYTSPELFLGMTEKMGLTLPQIRDARYHGVIHLVTAALGAEEFYTTENNPARYESLEQARETDECIKQAWLGHPKVIIIDNSTSFAEKLKRLWGAAARILGIPVPLEIERKFLVRDGVRPDNFPVPCQKIFIEQVYLISSGAEELRIRKRGQGDSFIYYLARKRRLKETIARVEKEEQISEREYLLRLREKDPTRKIIKKNRFCFIWENQYFELDIFLEPRPLIILEAELTEENESFSLPPFIPVEREVTGDPAFSNYEIARKG
jgi:CYTH domain-containing protein/thymidylate kinase